MINHYHLLIETPDSNLALAMRHLNGVYTQRYNRRHHRVVTYPQIRESLSPELMGTHLLQTDAEENREPLWTQGQVWNTAF
jgi:REP element-mobilizing transposase RayT